jgi:mgtE-like transporter
MKAAEKLKLPLVEEPFFKGRKHHWRARAFLNREFKEVFTAEIIAISVALIAGVLLAVFIDEILLIPGLLIMLPGFLEMRSSITGALAARIGTALDTKQITLGMSKNFVKQNIVASFSLTIVVALSLALMAYLVTLILFDVSRIDIFAIALIAALLANSIETIIAVPAVMWLYKKGHDPNDIMGPYISSTGDVIGVISILVAIFIVSWI